MIRRVFANKSTFREVRFQKGLNVILAERTESATTGDSRNGVGKSTLLDIVHFCFGSTTNPGQGLRVQELVDWAFSIEFDLKTKMIVATRSTNDPGKIVVSGQDDLWPIQPRQDEISDELSFTLEQWKLLLGWAFYGLQKDPDSKFQYSPSFRSLFSYFCRKGPVAFSSPFKYLPQQPNWNMQIHISFLLGLGWRNPSRWQQIRDELDGLTALKKAAKLGVVSGFVGTEGELQAQRIEIEARLDAQKSGIASFQVHPEYERFQDNANLLTEQIQDLTKKGVLQRRKRNLYSQAIAEEAPPEEAALESMYLEAGVTFGDAVLKTLGDARNFHRQIVKNRQEYLKEEIGRIESTISQNDRQIQTLSDERASLFGILETHGAFDDFARLNESLSSTRHEYETIMERLGEVTSMVERRQELKEERVLVERSARNDYSERSSIWSRAVRIFNYNSEALYDSPGRLVIDIGELGFEFKVEIERSGSQGIAKMEIFCFDLMLAEHLPSFNSSPNFIFHDSLLYDGVDSRQRAKALQLAAERSSEKGFQYICTLNSDMIPEDDFEDGFKINPFVRLKLHDGDVAGSLLGIRF